MIEFKDTMFEIIPRDDILDTMNELSPLFDKFAPSTGVPLTMTADRVRVRVRKFADVGKGDYVHGGDVRRGLAPVILHTDAGRVFAPHFIVRFGLIGNGVPIPIILHEMLHMYEGAIEYCYDGFHRVPTEESKQVKEQLLQSLAWVNDETDGCLSIVYEIYKRMGLVGHDILFLYKSVQLDIEMGYPLGMVFGYGAEGYIRGCMNVQKGVNQGFQLHNLWS